MANGALRDDLDRYWMRLALIAWVLIAAYYLHDRWPQMRFLALPDTDDNMRLMQVRGLLNGQGWYDLRQHRMNPPAGFDIHWSRLVDLPIAALILLFRPFMGASWAERAACWIAPLLPLSIAILGLGATVRRLVSPVAWPLAIFVLVCGCGATMLMFMPERIDHHGWQLAMLSLTVAGLSDPEGPRGGLLVGVASAVSLTIGLEMLPFAAGAGAIIGLRWVWDRAEAPRMSAYALSLAGGSALGFALFASEANRVLRCDALTPVWLSVMIAAGALLFILARLDPKARGVRLALAVVAGAAIIAGFALAFPQCLGRPEQVSPELAANWLNNVREAKPIYQHPLASAIAVATLPLIGVIGAAVAAWHARRGPAAIGWVAVLVFTIFAALMLLWQMRAAPGAQLLAVPGAVALAWLLVPRALNSRFLFVRVVVTPAVVLLASGLFAGLVLPYLPIPKPSAHINTVNKASGNCSANYALRPLDKYPAQTVLTFVDLGPRLITLTHHDAVAGPYHRNGEAILDVQHAFGGTPETFRAIAKRHGATLLLVCPNMAESTVYRSRNKGGFYDQLAHNRVPAFLAPMPLPAKSPLRLWRIN